AATRGGRGHPRGALGAVAAPNPTSPSGEGAIRSPSMPAIAAPREVPGQHGLGDARARATLVEAPSESATAASASEDADVVAPMSVLTALAPRGVVRDLGAVDREGAEAGDPAAVHRLISQDLHIDEAELGGVVDSAADERPTTGHLKRAE